MSTCERPLVRRLSIICGRRCSVCGPKTRSTYGARATIAAPSWLATQPPTPMSRSGLQSFRCLIRPRSWNTFSCARSRTEQVLKRIRSACSGSAVGSKPSASRSRSAIRSESYWFIWQPKLRMKTFFAMLTAEALSRSGEFRRRRQPDADELAVAVHEKVGVGSRGRQANRNDDEIALVADDRARREPHRLAVDGDVHLGDVPQVAAQGFGGDRLRSRLRQSPARAQQGGHEHPVAGGP